MARVTTFAEIGKRVVRWVGAMSAAHAGRASRRPWGEGLLDQSLSTRCYNLTWSDVDPDELVWLFPALAARHDSDRVAVLGAFLLRAIEREHDALDAAVPAGRRAGATLDVAERGQPSGHVAYRREQDASDDWRVVASRSQIACLEAALQALPSPGKVVLSPADAVMVSLTAGFNAGYLDPTLAIGHEQYAAGAWIGQLLRGSSAWLPDGLAVRLIDELASDGARSSPDEACARLLREAAAVSVGVNRLLTLARRVARTGAAELVHPAPGNIEQRLAWPPWNEGLHASVAARLGGRPATSIERGGDAAVG